MRAPGYWTPAGSSRTAALIGFWLLGAVDHEHIHRALRRFELEPQLFLHRREEGRAVVGRPFGTRRPPRQVAASGQGRVRRVFERELVEALEPCLVDDHRAGNAREVVGDLIDCDVPARDPARTEHDAADLHLSRRQRLRNRPGIAGTGWRRRRTVGRRGRLQVWPQPVFAGTDEREHGQLARLGVSHEAEAIREQRLHFGKEGRRRRAGSVAATEHVEPVLEEPFRSADDLVVLHLERDADQHPERHVGGAPPAVGRRQHRDAPIAGLVRLDRRHVERRPVSWRRGRRRG